MLSSRKHDQLEAAAAEMSGETAVFAANAGDLEAAVPASTRRSTVRWPRHPGQQRRHQPVLRGHPRRRPGPLRQDVRRQPARSGVLDQAPRNGRSPTSRVSSSTSRRWVASRAEFGLGVYNVTKAALIHLTRQLAGEIGPTRVVGIAPGLVQTDFAAVPRRELRRRPRAPTAESAGSASQRTSPTWRCSSPPTWRAGSPARPT